MMTTSYHLHRMGAMEANAAKRSTDLEPSAPEPDVPRCEQCGEALDPKRHRSRPIRERCVDCAFDTLPCTD